MLLSKGMELSDRGGSNGFGGYQNVAKEGRKSLLAIWLRRKVSLNRPAFAKASAGAERRKVTAKRSRFALR
jgi:hypothetical protein